MTENLVYDHREFYDKHFRSTLKQIADLCYEARMPILSLSAVANNKEGTTYESVFVSPETFGAKLYNNIFIHDKHLVPEDYPVIECPSDYNRRYAVEQERYSEVYVAERPKHTTIDYVDPDYLNYWKEKKLPYFGPLVNTISRMSYVYTIPNMIIYVPYNYEGKTDYRGSIIHPLASGIRLTEDRFTPYGFWINQFNPYDSQNIVFGSVPREE